MRIPVRVVSRFEPLGIVATGTIVRGNPGPSSGLDVDVAESDPTTALRILTHAVDQALAYRVWAAGRWQPRRKELLTQLDALNAPLAAHARAFFRGADEAARWRHAHAMLASLGVPTGFFEWESALA